MQVTAAPLAHEPARHASPVVQRLPSSQAPPSGRAGFEQTPESGSHVPASWHWSGGGHTIGGPPVQMPAAHVSPSVHALPSLHPVPSGASATEHAPLPGSQTPTWHRSGAGHSTGGPAAHAPPWHVSVCVHAEPSLHAVPSALAGFEHVPVDGSHVPAAWH